jgi:hypothetical protein
MITALILAFSSMAFLQFFISYCRSVIAASGALALSEQVWEVTGIKGREIRGEEFERLVQLTSLCPESGTGHSGIAAVCAYFRMVRFVHTTLRGMIPSVGSWTEVELSGCAHFAAVALDRRISRSRDLMAQQFSSAS